MQKVLKQLLPFLVVILVGLGGAYFFVSQRTTGELPFGIGEAPLEYDTDFKGFFNSNEDAEIVLILTEEDGEGVVVTRNTGPATDEIESVILFAPDGSHATVAPNAQGRAARYEDDKGNVIEYANYTDTTVDITVTESNGTQTVLPQHDRPDGGRHVSLIPQAHAESETADAYYVGGTGLILNSVGCAAGIIGSPLAPLSCGVVIVRVVGWAGAQLVDIPSCEPGEELVDCALNNYQAYSERKSLRGVLINKTTRTPIAGAFITMTNRRGQELKRIKTDSKGAYNFKITGGVSKYSITAFSAGFEEGEFTIIENGTALRVSDENGDTLVEAELGEEQQYILWYDLALVPEGVISGEVIDSESGLGISNAQISVSPLLMSTKTSSDGTFTLFPYDLKSKTTVVFTVSADGYETKAITYTLFAVLEGDEYKMETYNGIIKLDPEKEEEKKDDKDDKVDEGTDPPAPTVTPEVVEVVEVVEEIGTTFDGQYNEDFNRPSDSVFEEDGITVYVNETTYGTLSMAVEGDYVSCGMTVNSDFSSVIEGYEIPSGNAYLSAASCTGTIDSYGDFDLYGTLTGEAYIAEQYAEATMNFTVEGTAGDGEIWGNIYPEDGALIPFGLELYEEDDDYDDYEIESSTGWEGPWSGIAVDTSGSAGCSGEYFSFDVEDGLLHGFFESTNHDINGTFSMVKYKADGTRVLYQGELNTSRGDGFWQEDPFKSDCTGTFTILKN
jgi:hypothetical protein